MPRSAGSPTLDAPARRPRRSSHERRADVLAAARELFAQQGFHATSTRDLAAAADVNDALLYRYFPSKEAILTALVDEAIEAFSQLPTLGRGVAEMPLDTLMDVVGRAFLDTAHAHLDLLTILISEHHALAGDQRFVQFIDSSATGLGRLIEARTPNPSPGSGYLTARAYIGALIAYLLLQDVLGLSAVRPVDADHFLANLSAVTAAGIQSGPP